MKRPCECGCSYNDHTNLILQKDPEVKSVVLYCKNCDKHDTWCYNYREIGNLEYLEWLVK